MTRVSARRLSIYNFVWGLLKATKKVYLIRQKWKKKNKDTYLQAQPKNIKIVVETPNQPIEIKKSQIKVYLVLQKWKEGENSYGGYPTEFAGSTQNPKKIIRTPNLPIRTKNSPKKTMVSTLKVYRSQKFVWGLPDGICPGSLKNNRTQVKFRKS
jgi:hypothetical protein